MLNRKNKKGFTLAELLIVVAIIAVLVAIAVPLFVGALGNAEEKVFLANKRAAKSAAVTQIMSDNSVTSSDLTAGVKVTAEVDKDGNIKSLAFAKWASGDTETEKYDDWVAGTQAGNAAYKMVFKLTQIDVSGTTGLHLAE